ncbi:MAG: hypothetical protein ACRCYQ_12895 [Nocardioides sp.]
MCADSDESIRISDMRFVAEESAGGTVRFRVNFAGPGPGEGGGGSVKRLTPDYVEAEGAAGEVLPCDESRGSEIAFIVERLGPAGAYADGFELNYRYQGRRYTASSLHTVGICGSKGDNPTPIADLCDDTGR